jgi:esterase/lipase superfamily enzyme
MADITVHFATNREEVKGKIPFGPGLNRNSPLFLRYGTAQVAPPTSRREDFSLKSVRIAPEAIPGVNAALGAQVKLGSAAVYAGLQERLIANNADLLVFLHGYACDFEMAMMRAAELKHRWATAERPLEVAVFSWPADGTMVPLISYASDRDDARSSAKAVARALLRMVDFFRAMADERREAIKLNKEPPPACNARLHLVAHSMGNYTLRNAFQAMRSDLGGKVPRLFDTIFLMAADEDNDAFEDIDKFMHLPDLAHTVQVYFALNDHALTISDVTKMNPDRLGTAGPRTLTNLPQKVTLIDCTRVSSTPAISEANHQYYRQRPEVLADVQAVLAGVPADSIPNREFLSDKRAFRISAVP